MHPVTQHGTSQKGIIIKAYGQGKIIDQLIKQTKGSIHEVSAYVDPLKHKTPRSNEVLQRIGEIQMVGNIHKYKTIIVHYADSLINSERKILEGFVKWAEQNGTQIILITKHQKQFHRFKSIKSVITRIIGKESSSQ